MTLVRCGAKATGEDFHRTKKNNNSEYKDSNTEYIEIWTLGYPMGMHRISINIFGAVYTSLWIKKNWEIMKLSAQHWQRWKKQQVIIMWHCSYQEASQIAQWDSNSEGVPHLCRCLLPGTAKFKRDRKQHLEPALRNTQVQIQKVNMYH